MPRKHVMLWTMVRIPPKHLCGKNLHKISTFYANFMQGIGWKPLNLNLFSVAWQKEGQKWTAGKNLWGPGTILIFRFTSCRFFSTLENCIQILNGNFEHRKNNHYSILLSGLDSVRKSRSIGLSRPTTRWVTFTTSCTTGTSHTSFAIAPTQDSMKLWVIPCPCLCPHLSILLKLAYWIVMLKIKVSL